MEVTHYSGFDSLGLAFLQLEREDDRIYFRHHSKGIILTASVRDVEYAEIVQESVSDPQAGLAGMIGGLLFGGVLGALIGGTVADPPRTKNFLIVKIKGRVIKLGGDIETLFEARDLLLGRDK